MESGCKTIGQAQVEAMVASSISPAVRVPIRESREQLTTKQRLERMRRKQRTLSQEISDIKFTKEEVGPTPLSPTGMPSGSALTNILNQKLERPRYVRDAIDVRPQACTKGLNGGDRVYNSLEGLEDVEDIHELRYRSRTASVHSNDGNRAVQAAQAYNIGLASQEHYVRGGGDIRGSHTSSSSPFYIGSTPTSSYNPSRPGMYQMSNKFRCTVHFSPNVLRICKSHVKKQVSDGKGDFVTRALSSGTALHSNLVKANKRDHASESVEHSHYVTSPRGRSGISGSVAGSDNVRNRAASMNNPSTMVGIPTISYVQLQVAPERTAEEVMWKAIKSYIRILGGELDVVRNISKRHACRIWLGEEDGNFHKTTSPLPPGQIVAETGGSDFIITCSFISEGPQLCGSRRSSLDGPTSLFDYLFCFCHCCENTNEGGGRSVVKFSAKVGRIFATYF